MARTVKQLIEQLQKIEDQNQLVIAEYFIKQDFEYDDGETKVTKKAFKAVVDWCDRGDVDIWDEAREALNDRVYDEANK
jgi:hypothetical protein